MQDDKEADTESSDFSWKEEPSPAEDATWKKMEFTSDLGSHKTETNENHHDPRQLYELVHQMKFSKQKFPQFEKIGGRFWTIGEKQHAVQKRKVYNEQ